MNRIFELTLKVLRRKIIPLFYDTLKVQCLPYENNKIKCQERISELLKSDLPCMIARFGSVEMCAIANYLGVRDNPHNVWKYIKGDITEWWWQMTSINQLQSNAGFFPITEENVIRFCELMITDSKEIDILGSWIPQEMCLSNELRNAERFFLGNLEPSYHNTFAQYNWTNTLKGKRVLIIHPFVETIKKQYERREKLFKNPDFLPEFTLLTIKAVQSIGGTTEFKDWFEALEFMKAQMNDIDYDICILGCGAYGLPLAAHAKRTGHKAIHLGGSTQILFGIIGRRYETQDSFKCLFNEYWVRPSASETPAIARTVEGGCYW